MLEYTKIPVLFLSLILLSSVTIANFPFVYALAIIDEENLGKIEIFVEAENGKAFVKIKQDDVETEHEFATDNPKSVFGEIKKITKLDIDFQDSDWKFEAKNDDGTIEIFVKADYGIVNIKIEQAGELIEFEMDTSKMNKIRNEIKKMAGITLYDIDFAWKFEMTINPNEKKLAVCHVSPGNPTNVHVVVVSQNSLTAHLSHGDFLDNDCTKNKDEADKLRKKLEKEKNVKKITLKKIQKEVQNEINKLKKLANDLPDDKEEFKTILKQKKDQIKELLKDLKDNHAYDAELKKQLKKQLQISKHKNNQELEKHEKITKHKVDSKISSLYKSSDRESDAKKLGLDFKNGKTKIVIKLSNLDPRVLEKLESLGTVTAKNDKHIQLISDLDDITKIQLLEGIENIRPPFSAVQFEQQVSEGVYFINADLVHSAGITGKGIKVAVFDLAFTNNPEISDNIIEVKSFRQGLNYVPIQGFNEENAHGTAVAEIITDVAPDVELYLYAIETDIEFTQAVDEAISKDVDIISMSAGWPHFPTDGSSHITKKIEEAIQNNIVFVVPSGNFGNKHWEGIYGDTNLNGWHEFSNSDEGLSINVTSTRISEEKPITANLIWDVGLEDVADFDLVLVDPLGQIVDYSANEQTSKNDTPLEYIYHIPETEGIYALGIVYNIGSKAPAETPNATLEIFTPNDELEHSIVEGSVSVPTDANGAIVVGAVNHMSGELEPFSSQGPTNNGKLAPHIVGPDGVTTTSLNGEPFFGTSATAPYIAGMAALLLESNPGISPEQILSKIKENTALQGFYLENDYYDNAIGYGPANAVFLLQQEVVG